jgi:hypothetical protein
MKSYKQEAVELFAEGKLNKTQIAKSLKDKYNLPMSEETVRKEVCRQITKHRALVEECNVIGVPVDKVKYYWHKGKNFSMNVKGDAAPSYEEIRDDIIDQMKSYSPQYQHIHRSHSKDGHLLVIDPADIHIGKLASSFETGEDYNNQIAVQRVREGVKGILDKKARWIEKLEECVSSGRELREQKGRHEKTLLALEEYSKKFMLDYYFPSFSVGECKPIRAPGRRECGRHTPDHSNNAAAVHNRHSCISRLD